MDMPRELEVKVRIYERMARDLENYHPTSARDICLGYEWTKVLLADFMKAHKELIIPIMLDQSEPIALPGRSNGVVGNC
jgi:hypothetical protein